ncbi:MAG: phage portal protein [Oscillospiraceae bacterium]
MFDFLVTETDRINDRISKGSKTAMTDIEIIEEEIKDFKLSSKRTMMITGERYFDGKHDILNKKRTVIGEDGELTEVKNLPNNKIVDNQYKKMVKQKNNYLLGKPFSIQCDNKDYAKLLKVVFNRAFLRLIKNVGENSLNCGIGYMYVYYNESGELKFKRFKSHEIIPGWNDAEHTELGYFIRIYEVTTYEGKDKKIIEKVEVYDESGIHFFEFRNESLYPCEPFHRPYFTIAEGESETGYNWSKIPLIPFKYNDKETPLIQNVKSLQDGINTILSNFQDNMEEDARNTILVLVNYDGQNLGEFRKNLASYGAVKVKTVDGAEGDVRTLQVEVNCENYKSIVEIFKKAIIENAMGYDAKDDRMSGNANQMNIQSMYSDIDLDANDMETEYQAALEELLWFINCHFANMGYGDFENEEVEITFNRDMLINESEVIDCCNKSVDLSLETRIANHPWVDDPQTEIDRIKKERTANEGVMYGSAFGSPAPNDNKGGEGVNEE